MEVTGADVLLMLRPNGGWAIRDNDYSTAIFPECEPVSEADFLTGFNSYPQWKANKDAEELAAKESAQAKLQALGLTAEDIKALLS